MNSFGKLLRLKSTRLAALAYATVTLIFSRVPLLNYLGYEFSAAIGIIAGLLAGLLTISFFRVEFAENSTLSGQNLNWFALRSLSVNAFLILLPLILISLNAFFVKNCSFGEGLSFFVLIPCVTIVFAVALGLSTAVWVHRPVLWYLFFYFIILLHPIYLTFTSPQLFAYNFYFGYFPGFTYDEVLRITKPMVIFRILTIVAAVSVYSVAMVVAEYSSRSDAYLAKIKSLRNLFRLRPAALVALAGLAVLAATYAYRNELGFQSSASYIQTQLGGKHTTAHFTIYYSRKEVPSERIKWLAAEHEFRYMQVNRVLRTEFHGRIDSYIYPTQEMKRKLIGTSTTNIAKPWLREIHLSLDSFENSFRHELVHVLAGDYGMPILHISPSSGLIEGLAVAIDWNAGDRTPHELAAALFQFGLVKDIRGLFTFTGFAAKPSSISYLLSGSFCRFLIEEYGMRRFVALYRYGQFEKIYRQSLDDLVEGWKIYLESIEVPATDEARAKLLFARPSIFSKVCARAIADLNESGVKLFNEKKYAEASNAFQSSYAMSRNREAKMGFIASEFRLGRHDSLINMIRHTLEDSALAPTYVTLKLTLGDCYLLLGEWGEAEFLYKELRRMDISEFYNEACALRLEGLHQKRVEPYMKRYLSAAGDDTTRLGILRELLAENPDHRAGLNLIGRIYLREGNYKSAHDALSNIKKPFEDSLLNFQIEKMLGYSLLHLKNFQEAKIHLWQSLNYTRNRGDRNLIDDLIEQCDWMEDHRDLLE